MSAQAKSRAPCPMVMACLPRAPTCPVCIETADRLKGPRPMNDTNRAALDDAITTAGDALTKAERQRDALVVLLAAVDALDEMAHDAALPEESRVAVVALPTSTLWVRTRDLIKEANVEIAQLETAVYEAQRAFRAAEAEAAK